MRKIFNKKVASKVRNLMLAGTLIATPMMLVQGCTFGSDGGDSHVTNNDTCQDGDTTCNPGGGDDDDPVVDDGSTIVDDDGVERIVLAQAFNTTAANDIEPVQIYPEGDSRNSYDGYTFKETYIYDLDDVNGKKVTFDGEVNANTGQVDKRIIIRSYASGLALKNTDMLITNAQFTGEVFEETNSIYIDVPHNPVSPLYPFDPTTGVRLLQTGRLSDNTTVSVPKGSKLDYSGTPTIIKY